MPESLAALEQQRNSLVQEILNWAIFAPVRFQELVAAVAVPIATAIAPMTLVTIRNVRRITPFQKILQLWRYEYYCSVMPIRDRVNLRGATPLRNLKG